MSLCRRPGCVCGDWTFKEGDGRQRENGWEADEDVARFGSFDRGEERGSNEDVSGNGRQSQVGARAPLPKFYKPA